MNKSKRLGVILLVLAMIMAIAPAALAADPTDTGDQINDGRQGSIIVHKYDDTGTLTEEQKEGLNNGAQITDSTTLAALGAALEDVPFRVTQIKDLTDTYDIETSTLTVAVAQDIITANAASYDDTTLYRSTETTNSSGEATFSSLPQGIYLVEELPNPVSTDITTPFLVYIPLTVTETDTSGETPVTTQKLIYDVHVYPKNKKLYIDKLIDDDGDGAKTLTKNIGDTVEWNIFAGIPGDIESIDLNDSNSDGKYGYFFIDDTLDSRLDYSDIDIYLVDAVGDRATDITLVEVTDYSLSVPNTSSGYTGGGYIKLDFKTAAGIAKLAAAQALGYSIRIDIETTINRSAAYDLDTAIDNSAGLYYLNDNGDPSDPEDPIKPPTDPQVVVTGLSVVKYDKDAGYTTDTDGKVTYNNPLVGGEFDLYWSADNTADSYSKVASGTTDSAGLIYWVFDADESTGYGTDGVGYGYFYVLETKAPNGYELYGKISEVIELYYNDDDDNNLNGTWKLENVELGDDFELPTTGGMGTVLYTVIGLILICGAVAILLVSRKKRKAYSK